MSKIERFGGVSGTRQHWRRYVPMVAVLGAGILLTVLVTGSVYNADLGRFRDSLEHHSEDFYTSLQATIASNLKALDAINGLFIASDAVSRVEFQTFIGKLTANDTSIQALEWVPKVDRGQRETYEKAAQADGLSGFGFTERNAKGELVPAGQRDFYFPVFYAEPMKGNETALGFDLASEPLRLNALTPARDSGQLVVTPPIKLVQNTGGQTSILIAYPIYRSGQPTDTVNNRQKAFLGFALGEYRISTIIENALSAEDLELFNIYVYDVTAPAGQNVLYSKGMTEADLNRRDSFASSHTLDVAGRRWGIQLSPTAKFLAAQPNNLPILLAGLFLTLALTALVTVTVNRASTTALAVDERTRDLRKITVGLEAVATVSAAAASILDMDDLLKTVVELAKSSFDFYHAHIYLLDESGKNLVLAAGAGEAGRTMKARGHQIALAQEHSLVARAARSRQGVVANNVMTVPDFLPNVLLPDTRSELAVPLVVAERLIGVLDVQSNVINRFTDEDLRIQETLADQIAIAVQNARAFIEIRRAEEETVKRAAELETVAQVSVAVTTILDIDELLQKVADLTKERFDLYHAHIYLLDKSGENLVLAAGAGDIGRTMKAMGRQISIHQETSLVARAARERHGVIVNDVTQADDFLPNPLLPETRSEMAIPMIVGDTLIGVLDTQAAEVDRFTPEDIRVKTTLTEQIAVAVQNARTFVEMRAAETSLKESTAQLLEAQQLAKLGRWTWSPVTNKVTANDQMFEIFDLPPADGMTFDTFVNSLHPDDRQRAVQVISETLQTGGSSYTLEYRTIVRDGSVRDIFALGAITRADDGTPLEVIGTAQDVTERRRLEAESRVLYDAATKLTSATTPDQLLQAVNDYARNANADGATLIYIENDAQGKPEWAEIVAEWNTAGMNSQLGLRFYLPEFPFAKFWMSSPNKPLLINDILNDERVDEITRQVMGQTGIRGCALLPLNVQGRWLGLLSFSWTAPHTFNPQEQRIYTALSAQATPTAEAMRAFQEVQAANVETDLLYGASNKIATSGNPNQVLDAISDYARSDDAYAATMLYIDLGEDGKPLWLEVVAEWHTRGIATPVGSRFYLPDFPFAELWISNPDKPLVLEDVSTSELLDPTTRAAYLQFGIQGSVLLPMNIQGRWVGLILFSWDTPHKFTERDLRIYNALGQQTTPAVDAVRSFKEMETARRRAETLARINAALSAATDEGSILSAVGAFAEQYKPTALSIAYMTENAEAYPTASTTMAMWRDGALVPEHPALGISLDLSRFPLTQLWVSAPNDALLVEDFDTDPRIDETLRDMMRSRSVRATAAIPLHSSGHWQGMITIQWDEPHTFTEEERIVYSSLTQTAASVVASRRAFLAVEKAREQAEVMAQVNAALSEATDERAILSSVGLFAEQYKPMALSIGYLEEDANGNPTTSTTMAFWQGGGLVPNHPTLGVTIDLTKLPFTALWSNEPNEVLLIEDFDTDPRVDEATRDLMHSRNIRATAAIPLHSGGQWQAMIAIQWGEVHPFTVDERAVYSSLTQTAASVVASRRAFLAEEDSRRISERRAGELALVANVSAAVSSILNVDDLLKTVVELTKESFGLYHAHIYLLDEATEHMVLAAGAGEPGRFMKAQGWRIAIANEHSLVARAARSRESVTINDVTQVADFLPNALLPETRSEMAIPMIVGGKLLGVLDVQSEQVARFTDEDVRIKTTLADQVAVAVENANAFTDIQEAREDLNLLYEVSAQINAAQDEQQLVEAVVAHWANEDASAASLVLFENENADTATSLTRVGDWTRDGQSRGRGVAIPLASFPILKLLDRHKVGFSDDVQLDPRMDDTSKTSLDSLGIGAFIFTPITIGERWMGTFGMYSDEPHIHTEREIRIMRSIGEQLTAAVERLNLVRLTQKRAVEMETVAKVSAAASSVLNVHELLQTVVDLTKASFSLYHAHVYLFEPAAQTLVLAAGAGEPGRAMKAKGHNISFHNEHSLVASAARSRRSVVVNDVTKSPHFLPNPLLPDTRSEMSIPLVVGDRLVGVLDVQSDLTTVFSNQEVQIMTTLGDQVAVAVQNAQLYEQQTEAAEQLRAVDRLKSEFLANMSHELRTPLNSIIGYAEVMIDGIDGELPDEAVEDVQAIHDSGLHLLSMINDILDLAKIEAGRMELDLETVKLGEVAEEVRRITNVLYKDKPVELIIDVSPDLPEVWADQVRLRQIMTNLVSNAGKFTSQGEVRISAQMVSAQYSSQSDMISISIADTGEGIAEEHLDLVFQQFRQADNSSTRKAGGTGLGLTITRHLVEMQGGHIWVESTPGAGSTFTFTVPVAKVSIAQ